MSTVARQSTALEIPFGPVLDEDGLFISTAVVGELKIKKTTGNFAALDGSATLTYVSGGIYDLVLTANDLDTVGLATVIIDDTPNVATPLLFQVVEEAVFDALFAANANAWSGAAGSSIGVANMTQISGDSVAADNLERWFDGTVGFATSGSDVAFGAFSMTTLTASGAVAFQSTFAITSTVTFNAFTITNALTVSGNTTFTGTTTYTGHATYLDGWSIPAPSTLNRDGMKITGNGTGEAINLTAGATGYAISLTATDHAAIGITNDSTSPTILISNNDTGNLITFSGDGGNSAINTNGAFTGNLTGILSTLTTYTGNTPQTGDSFAIVNSGTFGNAALKTLIDAIASGALSAADVWSYATRIVTAATNITSTGGTTVPQTGDTYALANGASGFVAIKGVVDAILLDTGTDGVVLSTATKEAIATALLDLAAGVESGVTLRQAMRGIAAVVVGLLPSGAGTGTEAFKGIGQAAGGTTRVTNTVDNDGNRTAQTLNL